MRPQLESHMKRKRLWNSNGILTKEGMKVKNDLCDFLRPTIAKLVKKYHRTDLEVSLSHAVVWVLIMEDLKIRKPRETK